MGAQRYKPEETISELHEAEVPLAAGTRWLTRIGLRPIDRNHLAESGRMIAIFRTCPLRRHDIEEWVRLVVDR